MTGELAAAVDLGTNTALLLVARGGAGGELEVVADLARTPRLGAGLAARGTLAPEAVERTLLVLSEFAAYLAELGVPRERTRVVSTAVLRRARDAQAFVERARERTGLVVEIASGEEEARLGQIAVAAEGVGPEAVVVDIGGGSTEVTCSALGFARSLPLGAVVLTESTPAAELASAATAAVAELPKDLARERRVVVLGGTGLNAVSLALGFERFDHRRAEGAVARTADVRAWVGRLGGLGPDDLEGLPIERERAGILTAGLALLAAVLERVGAKDFRVTGRGLRFGVVRELLARGR